MVNFDFDLGELVSWHGSGGEMTLWDAVVRFRKLPPRKRVHVMVWRDRGKENPIAFDTYDLEELAQLPEFQ